MPPTNRSRPGGSSGSIDLSGGRSARSRPGPPPALRPALPSRGAGVPVESADPSAPMPEALLPRPGAVPAPATAAGRRVGLRYALCRSSAPERPDLRLLHRDRTGRAAESDAPRRHGTRACRPRSAQAARSVRTGPTSSPARGLSVVVAGAAVPDGKGRPHPRPFGAIRPRRRPYRAPSRGHRARRAVSRRRASPPPRFSTGPSRTAAGPLRRRPRLAVGKFGLSPHGSRGRGVVWASAAVTCFAFAGSMAASTAASFASRIRRTIGNSTSRASWSKTWAAALAFMAS